MSNSIQSFMDMVTKRNANEPEFLQAVHEVAETVIPFIEKKSEIPGQNAFGKDGRGRKGYHVPGYMDR